MKALRTTRSESMVMRVEDFFTSPYFRRKGYTAPNSRRQSEQLPATSSGRLVGFDARGIQALGEISQLYMVLYISSLAKKSNLKSEGNYSPCGGLQGPHAPKINALRTHLKDF